MHVFVPYELNYCVLGSVHICIHCRRKRKQSPANSVWFGNIFM